MRRFFCWTSTRTRQPRTDPEQTLFEDQAKKIRRRKKTKRKSAKKTVRTAHLHKQMWDGEEGWERGGRERQKREREREENEICINDLGQFNPFAFLIFLCFASHLLVRNASRMREDREHKGSRIILILFPIFFIFLSFFFLGFETKCKCFFVWTQQLSAASSSSSSANSIAASLCFFCHFFFGRPHDLLEEPLQKTWRWLCQIVNNYVRIF